MSLASLILDHDYEFYYDAENPARSTKILGVYIFAFTPSIYHCEDGSYNVQLFNVLTKETSDVYVHNFGTHQEALVHSQKLIEDGAIGAELFEEFDIANIKNWHKKIKNIILFTANANATAVLRFTDILEWQMACIDAGLEIEDRDRVYAAVIPMRLFTAILAYASIRDQTNAVLSIEDHRTFGYFSSTTKGAKVSSGLIYSLVNYNN